MNKGETKTVVEVKGRYAAVNGLNLYYETYGAGQPLVLLHGGFGMISMFDQILPGLAQSRQVIGVELQGHGHTADIDRPFSFEQMADDVAALIRHLGLEKADVLGYSLGGGAAWQTAIRHPDVVRKLVAVSAPIRRDGWYPGVLQGMAGINADGMMQTPLYEAYASVAPNPEHFARLADKTRQLLGQPYDWSEQVKAIRAPVLIVIGDADSIPPAHAAEIFGLLGGGKQDAGWNGEGLPNSQLAVLPGTTHYVIVQRAVLLLPILTPFLDAPMPRAGG